MMIGSVERSGRFRSQSYVHVEDGALHAVSVNEVPEIRDLRDGSSWSKWVDAQQQDLKAMLGLAGYEYDEPTDTISLVFASSAMRCMTESTCEQIVELIRSFYDVRRRDWVGGRTELPKDEYPPREAMMPHLSIEIAPPFVHSH